MARVGRYPNPYVSFEFAGDPPAGTTAEVLSIETADRAASRAVLWLPAGPRPRTAVSLMHPRVDFTRHYAIPGLLGAGYAVFTQNSRSVGNDSMLVHEQILLDVAAGFARLRELGFDRIVAIGNSGGGSLYSFYLAQAAASSGRRLTETAAGDALDLNGFDMPSVDAMIYLAAHPGEGTFLLQAIDPSVTDEDDPCSCDPALDMYAEANGFRPPPQPSKYPDEFLSRYRSAQRERVRRIDEVARTAVAHRRDARVRAAKAGDDVAARRAAIAVPFFRVYRTEADPRYVDPSLDPSRRDYGSLFGSRPDLINYGPFGFARVVTPEAWLSTWSGLSSRASVAADVPAVTMPSLVVSYDSDNAVYPSDACMILDRLGSDDKTLVTVEGDHYGHPPPGGSKPGREEALRVIADWLRARDY